MDEHRTTIRGEINANDNFVKEQINPTEPTLQPSKLPVVSAIDLVSS